MIDEREYYKDKFGNNHYWGLSKWYIIYLVAQNFCGGFIFAIFPAHIFPAKNLSTVNIFQLKFFQSIIRTTSHDLIPDFTVIE